MMPTINQLPVAAQVAATDQFPITQGNVTRRASVGTLLNGTQPAIALAARTLLGRVSASAGGPEPVAVGTGLAVLGGALTATAADHAMLPAAAALGTADEVVINSGGSPFRLPATALRSLFSAGAGVQISAGGSISAPGGGGGATDASPLPVTAAGSPAARTLAARAADEVNVRDYGAVLNGVADDTAAVTTALAKGAARVPAGIAKVTATVSGLVGRLRGEGQVQTSDGHRRGPLFARRTSAPSSYGVAGDIAQAFDGDLSTVHLAIEHRIEGVDTLTKPATEYVLHPENSAIALSMVNSSGWNQATGNQTGGRTGVAAFNASVGNVGQGDTYFLHVGGFVSGTKPGSTHFLANPAVVGLAGEFFAFTDGTYQEADEFSHDDGGFGGIGYDVAVSSTVRNFTRTNDTGAKGAWWLGFRLQSLGPKGVDVGWQAVGRWNNVFDTTSVIAGPSKAVWTQAAGQRTYLNAASFPDGFSNPAKVAPGTTYTHFNPATSAFEVVVGGAVGLSVTGSGASGVTPVAASNDGTLATTAFVKAAVAAAGSGGGYTLPTASTTVLGGVRVDGTTVTVNGAGVVSVVGTTVARGLAAAGSSSAGALAVSARVNVVRGGAAGAGVRLATDHCEVANLGVVDLLLYPATGGTLNGGAVDAPVVLPANQRVRCVSTDGVTFDVY